MKRLAPRWFVLRDAYAGAQPVLPQPRWAMTLLRGPMTRRELEMPRDARWTFVMPKAMNGATCAAIPA